ncbi:MAG: hypothetical protein R3C61_16310 [Bacteroidia bacterium]
MKWILTVLTMITGLHLAAADYDYTLTWLSPHTHTYVVSLAVSPEEGQFTDFQIPAWRPGRYRLQDFAGGISAFSAKDDSGTSAMEKTDEHLAGFHSSGKKWWFRIVLCQCTERRGKLSHARSDLF